MQGLRTEKRAGSRQKETQVTSAQMAGPRDTGGPGVGAHSGPNKILAGNTHQSGRPGKGVGGGWSSLDALEACCGPDGGRAGPTRKFKRGFRKVSGWGEGLGRRSWSACSKRLSVGSRGEYMFQDGGLTTCKRFFSGSPALRGLTVFLLVFRGGRSLHFGVRSLHTQCSRHEPLQLEVCQ